MGESIYKDIEQLLITAQEMGVIRINFTKSPKSAKHMLILVINPDGWTCFLNEVLNKSQNEEEKKFARYMIESFANFMKNQMELDNEIFVKKMSELTTENEDYHFEDDEEEFEEKPPITEKEINALKDTLEKTKTVEDFLRKIK